MKYLFGKLYKKKINLHIYYIRNVSIGSTEHIKTYVDNWIEKGFINYFGLQRFGSRTLATQTVGK